jgi:hypothetical protein
LSPELDYEGYKKVYMVGQGEKPHKKIVKEIQWEVEEEIAQVDHLARDAERGKRHNGL